MGERVGPFSGRLTPGLVRRYAQATKDPNPAALAGDSVPPIALVTQIWEAQQAGYDAFVPAEVKATMTGGVHGEHDVVLHRPVMPDEPLQTWVEAYGSHRGGREGNHNVVTLHYATHGDDGTLIADQWWTTVLLHAVGEPVGAPPPRHGFPDEARRRPIGVYRIRADEDMPRRYAEVSGDWMPHHFEDEAARRSGFSRRFLHGLCTMALCAQGVVHVAADGDPRRIRRLAVRFAAPTYVGDDLVVHLYEGDRSTVVFEAEAGGAGVIRNGFSELGS